MSKRKKTKTNARKQATVTLSAFAEIVDRSLPTIRAAIGRGMPTLGRVGREHRIEIGPALRWWLLDIEARHELELEQATRDPDFAEARRRLVVERTRTAKLANDEKEGSLIPVAVVERDNFEDGRMIREAMLNIPDRIAGELAAESSEAKVHARLDKEIRIALEGTAAAIQKKLMRQPKEPARELRR